MAAALPGIAQLDRGTLTGALTDGTGARVPNAQVTLSNAETGGTFSTVSNELGQFMHPNLPAGVYDLEFSALGFRSLKRTGVRVSATEVVRVDVVLEVGTTTEVVQVSADVPRIRTDTGELSTTISNKDMTDLPFSFGFGRLMENFTYRVVPGVQGNRFTNNINGQVYFSRDSLLDGASMATDQQGNSVGSGVSMEAIAEMKVITSGISAEFGRSQSGIYNYIMKSGTNELHGSLYGSLRNESLNANEFGNNARGVPRNVDRKHNWAGSFGAPVYIPGIYNGRNKTFFYTALEKYVERSLAFGSPNRTAPVPEFYEGDFSRLLGPVTPQTDALGRQILRGAIYDPATFTQLPNGRWIGDMFPGNRIPASRFSRTSRQINELAKKHYLPTLRDSTGQIPLVNNSFAPTNPIPFSTEYFFSVKVDHNVNERHKLSVSYAHDLNNRGRSSNSAQQRTLFDQQLDEGGPLAFFLDDRSKSPMSRVAWDWTLSPQVLNHMTASFQRQAFNIQGSMADLDGSGELGIQGLSTFGYPQINWGDGPFVTLDRLGNPTNDYTANTSFGLLNTMSVYKGRHFLKFGVDLRANRRNTRATQGGAFNFHARGTAIPNETISGTQIGYSFASYLLGIVDSAQLSEPVGLGGRLRYYAGFFQDDIRVNSKLTLNLGIRWEYQPPGFEAHDRLSSWNPNKTDPVSGLPGAYDFAGDCTGCTGKRYFGRKSFRDWAPRFGFAFQPGRNWTIRGAYGIFFTPDMFNGRGPTPLDKATSIQAAGTFSLEPDPVTPWAGIFNWDNGFPGNRYVAPVQDASWGNANRPGMIDPNYGRTGYSQNWNFNVQHALPAGFVVDAGYVGNKSTGIRVGDLALLNQLAPDALSQYGRNLTNAVTTPAQAAANGIAYPYPGFRGTVASALRPYPQVQGNSTVQVWGSPLGFSTYNSLQLTVNRQYASGITLYASYVWSKTLSNMASLQTNANGSRPLDYYNLGLEKSLAVYDVPHAVRIMMNAELPFGRGKSFGSNLPGAVQAVLGGWAITPILQYESGAPLTFTASRPCAANCWNGAAFRPNVAPGALKVDDFDPGAFDAINVRSPGNTYLLKSAFSDVQPLNLGTAAFTYGDVRAFGTINEDVAIHKNFWFREKYRFQLRVDCLNILNRHLIGNRIETNVTNQNFGQVTGVAGKRELQLGMRIDF